MKLLKSLPTLWCILPSGDWIFFEVSSSKQERKRKIFKKNLYWIFIGCSYAFRLTEYRVGIDFYQLLFQTVRRDEKLDFYGSSCFIFRLECLQKLFFTVFYDLVTLTCHTFYMQRHHCEKKLELDIFLSKSIFQSFQCFISFIRHLCATAS